MFLCIFPPEVHHLIFAKLLFTLTYIENEYDEPDTREWLRKKVDEKRVARVEYKLHIKLFTFAAS